MKRLEDPSLEVLRSVIDTLANTKQTLDEIILSM